MIGFGAPLWLALLVCVPLAAAILWWGARQRRLAALRFAGSGLSRLYVGGHGRARRAVKAALLLAVIALLAFAIARPQLGQQQVQLPREGSDVVIAMDVSRSMGVTDVTPTRFDRAKQAADALIEHLGGDRVGLVVFGGSAVLRFPLTTDFSAARQVIDGLAIKDGGVKAGTDIGAALTTARVAFTGDKTRGKVIVLISDGENLTGSDVAAASAAASAGILVETAGVGTAAGGPVTAFDFSTQRAVPVIDPATGRTAISKRNDGNLQQIATAGHGNLYDANTTAFAFDLSGVIDSLQKTRFQSANATIPIERFQIPLALALALLLLDSVILDQVERRAQRRAPVSVAGGARPTVAVPVRSARGAPVAPSAGDGNG